MKLPDLHIALDVTQDDLLVAYSSGSTSTITMDQLRTFIRDEKELDRYDLAAAVTDYYKRILDAPLSTGMLEEWDRLSAFVRAVVEMADKYTTLIETEINSKIEV